MGFLQIKRSTIYLAVESTAKPIRPLADNTIGVWINSIPGCSSVSPDGKKVNLRSFRTVNSDLPKYAWLKNNPDPLWDKLADRDKFNRKAQRQDFPSRPQHLLPVWSYLDNDVKIVKQGSQFYEEMDKYSDQGGNKVSACDWLCWTTGKGTQTKYNTSRQDISIFKCPIPEEEIKRRIQALMTQALADLDPFKDEAQLLAFVYGKANEEAGSFPFGVNTPDNPVSPSPYVPGGLPSTNLGVPPVINVPVSQPVSQPVPQQAVYYPPQTTVAPYPIPAFTAPGYQAVPSNTSTPGYQPPSTTAVPNYTPPTVMPAPNYTAPLPVQPQVSPKNDVPNAPVSVAPVFAPPPTLSQAPVTAQPAVVQPGVPQSPGDFMVTFGKYNGKTLAWVQANDPSYLNYLRANKRELTGIIDQLLNSPATMQAPVAQAVAVDDDQLRSQLSREISDKIMKVPEFQGNGIQQNMIPFIKNIIGTAYYSDAPLDQLKALKSALDAKLAQAGV